MNKEAMLSAIKKKYNELNAALAGDDLRKIRELALELHAMVHPAEVSGGSEKTIADHVWDYMMQGNQNEFVPRETYQTDLKYAGSASVPICWQFWHAYRIEDLISNILIADKPQIFNEEWKHRIGSFITDTGNALEPDALITWGREINAEALKEYMIAVGKNTRQILSSLTMKQIRSMVPEERVMRILEEGGVTTDFRSIWLLVFWGRLTVGGMILTPLTWHHMMHLPTSIDRVKNLHTQATGMTYEEIVHLVRDAYENADARNIFEHIALQVNMTGEGAGVFYIEAAGRAICVEPYDYYDCDGQVTLSSDTVIKMAKGKMHYTEAKALGLMKSEGNLEKIRKLGEVKPKRRQKKKTE
ncbi:MAG: SCP2 sterol-binding domain-containing protein [Lachnospiraceae bacterium]|nr:SCP2 sterol-binding domain-containing protein [Lachnospiraceae bacterium]